MGQKEQPHKSHQNPEHFNTNIWNRRFVEYIYSVFPRQLMPEDTLPPLHALINSPYNIDPTHLYKPQYITKHENRLYSLGANSTYEKALVIYQTSGTKQIPEGRKNATYQIKYSDERLTSESFLAIRGKIEEARISPERFSANEIEILLSFPLTRVRCIGLDTWIDRRGNLDNREMYTFWITQTCEGKTYFSSRIPPDTYDQVSYPYSRQEYDSLYAYINPTRHAILNHPKLKDIRA